MTSRFAIQCESLLRLLASEENGTVAPGTCDKDPMIHLNPCPPSASHLRINTTHTHAQTHYG